MSQTVPDHPTLPIVKQRFPDVSFFAASFRGQVSLVVPALQIHDVLAFLRHDASCDYDFLCDVVGIDYLEYPAPAGMAAGRYICPPPPTSGRAPNGPNERSSTCSVSVLMGTPIFAESSHGKTTPVIHYARITPCVDVWSESRIA